MNQPLSLPTPWRYDEFSDSFIISDRDGLEIARVFFDEKSAE